MRKKQPKYPAKLYGHLFVGWLAASVIASGYGQIADIPSKLNFYVGLIAGIIGAVMGIVIYHKKYEKNDEI